MKSTIASHLFFGGETQRDTLRQLLLWGNPSIKETELRNKVLKIMIEKYCKK